MKYVLIVFTIILASCHWSGQKAKEAVNKTGEVAGKAGSEFVDGVSKGIEKSFNNEVKFSDELTKLGLSSGKIMIRGTDSTTDNILTTYLIFDNDFERKITVKVFSETGQEYGRVKLDVKGLKGEARYVDFVFDSRTNIDGKGKIEFE